MEVALDWWELIVESLNEWNCYDFDDPSPPLYEYEPLDYHTCALFLCSSHWLL